MPTPINSLVLHICRRSETEHASSKQKPLTTASDQERSRQ